MWTVRSDRISSFLWNFLSLPMDRTSSFREMCSLCWDKNQIKSIYLAQKLIVVSVMSLKVLIHTSVQLTHDLNAVLHVAGKMETFQVFTGKTCIRVLCISCCCLSLEHWPHIAGSSQKLAVSVQHPFLKCVHACLKMQYT